MAGSPGLVDAESVRPWAYDVQAMLPGRTPVLALGSNGDPDVLRAKLLARGVSPVVPLVPLVVTGVSMGHSAHVSLSGYVAAAPRDDPSGAVRGVLTWLDDQQLSVLDQTEPNYQRVALRAARYAWATVVPVHLARVWVYRSVWGVLTLGEDHPLPLGSQERLHRLLAADPAVDARLPLHDSAATARALADQHLQVWLRQHWARAGHAAPDGLVTGPR